MWGCLGPQIHLGEYIVAEAETAIRVTQEGEAYGKRQPRWRAAGNLCLNGGQEPFVFRSDPEAPGGADAAALHAARQRGIFGVRQLDR